MASEYWTILDTAKTLLAALPEFAAFTFAIRERPFCSPEHGDALPFACVSGDAERVRELSTQGRAFVDYPVYLTLFTEKGAALQDAAAVRARLEQREAARHALWRPRVHPTQGMAGYDPAPPWDFGALAQTYSISIQKWTFTNDEPC